MDPLSITASIIAILQLTTTVIECLSNAKGASTDRTLFTTEVSNLSSLLFTLVSRLEEGRSNEPWHKQVRALSEKDRTLDQYRAALEQLQHKISKRGGITTISNTLLWKYVKDDIQAILSRIECLKTLVQIALQIDHLSVSLSTNS
jgi:thymidylate synthase